MLSPSDLAHDLLGFIDSSPTAYHAVHSVSRRLMAAGFRELCERDAWALSAGDRCFVARNDSSVIAFVVGSESPASAGFQMIGAHTDAPLLKVKPLPELYRSGMFQLGVEVYGGMLLSTWLDRDLGLAGRVLTVDASGTLRSHLVHIRRPLARVANLAIHLDREVNTRGLVLNPQQHMVPIVGLEGNKPTLRALLAAELDTQGVQVRPEEIVDFDIGLVDTQPSAIGGLEGEFIFAPRLDNLASCHSALSAMLDAIGASPTVAGTRVLAFWDHEECGSRSAQGASGPFARQVIERILEAHPVPAPQAMARAVASSFLISADMAHAVHPNYADRHEAAHQPMLGKGPVIKINAGQSYATDGVSAARFALLCRKAGFEPQRFVTRSDLPCGTTIGPLTAALTGIKTVDVGNPMLSMHSIREMASVEDHAKMAAVMREFLVAG